jgi:hypothetical protein
VQHQSEIAGEKKPAPQAAHRTRRPSRCSAKVLAVHAAGHTQWHRRGECTQRTLGSVVTGTITK